MPAFLEIRVYSPRDVSPQHDVVPRFRRHVPAPFTIYHALDETLLWQQV
jgi:hypothetical protein